MDKVTEYKRLVQPSKICAYCLTIMLRVYDPLARPYFRCPLCGKESLP